MPEVDDHRHWAGRRCSFHLAALVIMAIADGECRQALWTERREAEARREQSRETR